MGEMIAAHAVVVLEMADHRLGGGATLVGLALADAFDCGPVQGINLAAALVPVFFQHAPGQAQLFNERFFEVLGAGNAITAPRPINQPAQCLGNSSQTTEIFFNIRSKLRV